MSTASPSRTASRHPMAAGSRPSTKPASRANAAMSCQWDKEFINSHVSAPQAGCASGHSGCTTAKWPIITTMHQTACCRCTQQSSASCSRVTRRMVPNESSASMSARAHSCCTAAKSVLPVASLGMLSTDEKLEGTIQAGIASSHRCRSTPWSTGGATTAQSCTPDGPSTAATAVAATPRPFPAAASTASTSSSSTRTPRILTCRSRRPKTSRPHRPHLPQSPVRYNGPREG
mmetsp:Transcript_39956/g.84445  ORF Transcript_39956/g.84445 Transcript_39956/m.84445 type:complete len:232 (-) Transcript_39956:263-958(-)